MQLTIGRLLQRGAAAGAIAGLCTGVFTRALTETHIGHALKFEDATGIGLGPGEAPLFTRGTQLVGGMAAALVYGVVLGLVFAVAFALLRHRIPSPSEFGRAAALAVAAFFATSLLPGLKYPPNPPTVGNPDTIGQRTGSYLLLLIASVVLTYGIFHFWGWVGDRLQGAPRFAATAGLLVVALTVLYVAFPASPDPIMPPDNEAAPALQVANGAPKAVRNAMLDTAKKLGTESIRDPQHPDLPIDLTTATAEDLVGAPVQVSTTALVPHAYTTVVWQFRIASFGGLVVMWTVMAIAFGWLVDRLVGATPEAAAA